MQQRSLRCPMGHRNIKKRKYRTEWIPEEERRPNGPVKRKIWSNDMYYCGSCNRFYSSKDLIRTDHDDTRQMKYIKKDVKKWSVRCPKGHTLVEPRMFRRIEGKMIRWTGWYCRSCSDWYKDEEIER